MYNCIRGRLCEGSFSLGYTITVVRECVWVEGSGRCSLEVRVLDTGGGLVVTVLGREGAHVGAIALSTDEHGLRCPGHRDDELAVPIAAALGAKLNVPVAVVAGVHLDAITRAEIDEIMDLVPAIVGHVEAWVVSNS